MIDYRTYRKYAILCKMRNILDRSNTYIVIIISHSELFNANFNV